MKMRVLGLLSIPAVMLVAVPVHAQRGSAPQSTMATGRGTVGLSHDTPGTNSLGTAESVGGGGGGQGAASVGDDPAVKAEEHKVDQSLKSICRGC